MGFRLVGAASRNVFGYLLLHEHGNGKLIRNAFHRTTDAAVSAMPTLVGIDNGWTVLFHLQDIAGTVLYAVSTQTAFIHVKYRRHNFTSFFLLQNVLL